MQAQEKPIRAITYCLLQVTCHKKPRPEKAGGITTELFITALLKTSSSSTATVAATIITATIVAAFKTAASGRRLGRL